MITDISCFKAYDIRGRVPDVLNADIAHALGMSFAQLFNARNVVIGRDVRLSGALLRDALATGLSASGASVTDIDLCGTEEIYYAVARHQFDGGIMITGSHNPADENGFKLLRTGAVPVSADSGLNELKDRVAGLLTQSGTTAGSPPTHTQAHAASFRTEYVRWLLRYSGMDNLSSDGKSLKIVGDAGNGCAGLVLNDMITALPFDFIMRQAEPDGNFPNGVPNPLLPERRLGTASAVRELDADMGIAWDGDFDRCFFYDGEGNFIEGYYCVGLLTEEMLRRFPGSKIIYDTRVYWNTRDIIVNCGGQPVAGKTGHAFMKEKMRAENAVYGGEMSAHHYFRDFAYCDSGMLPWLLTVALLVRTGKSLAELVAERMAAYPCSGEINRRVTNAPLLIKMARDKYAGQTIHEDHLDGINLEFPSWRFNLRMSNTEPILRLNVESRGDRALLEDKTAELLRLIDTEGNVDSAS